jgi:hypothetical protein
MKIWLLAHHRGNGGPDDHGPYVIFTTKEAAEASMEAGDALEEWDVRDGPLRTQPRWWVRQAWRNGGYESAVPPIRELRVNELNTDEFDASAHHYCGSGTSFATFIEAEVEHGRLLAEAAGAVPSPNKDPD